MLAISFLPIYVPHIRGGGHIVFDADPVGVGIGVTIFVCRISCEPVVGFLPNFQGHNRELIRFC